MLRELRQRIRTITHQKRQVTLDELQAVYQGTFKSPGGDTVLDDLCTRFHVMGPAYKPGDSHETAFREGERNVVLYILGHVLKPRE